MNSRDTNIARELTHRQFWDLFVQRFEHNPIFSGNFNKRSPLDRSYYDLAWGGNRVHIVIRRLIRDRKCKLEIYIKGNLELFDVLKAHAEEMQSYVGSSLAFTSTRLTGNRAAPKARIIYLEKNDIETKANDNYWNQEIEWIQDKCILLKSAIEKYGEPYCTNPRSRR